MNAELINIKSIDIEVKAVKQMIYSNRPNLVSFYAQLNLNENYSDDEYINISKYKKGNKTLIFEILNSNWLLKLENLESKTEKELDYERFCLQNEIDDIKKKVNSSNAYYTVNNIKLLEYKLSCLEDYIYQRMNKQESQMLVKKLSAFTNNNK